jgi:hypothetical protein
MGNEVCKYAATRWLAKPAPAGPTLGRPTKVRRSKGEGVVEGPRRARREESTVRAYDGERGRELESGSERRRQVHRRGL